MEKENINNIINDIKNLNKEKIDQATEKLKESIINNENIITKERNPDENEKILNYLNKNFKPFKDELTTEERDELLNKYNDYQQQYLKTSDKINNINTQIIELSKQFEQISTELSNNNISIYEKNKLLEKEFKTFEHMKNLIQEKDKLNKELLKINEIQENIKVTLIFDKSKNNPFKDEEGNIDPSLLGDFQKAELERQNKLTEIAEKDVEARTGFIKTLNTFKDDSFQKDIQEINDKTLKEKEKLIEEEKNNKINQLLYRGKIGAILKLIDALFEPIEKFRKKHLDPRHMTLYKNEKNQEKFQEYLNKFDNLKNLNENSFKNFQTIKNNLEQSKNLIDNNLNKNDLENPLNYEKLKEGLKSNIILNKQLETNSNELLEKLNPNDILKNPQKTAQIFQDFFNKNQNLIDINSNNPEVSNLLKRGIIEIGVENLTKNPNFDKIGLDPIKLANLGQIFIQNGSISIQNIQDISKDLQEKTKNIQQNIDSIKDISI